MLAAGNQDDFENASIYTNTQKLAAAMAITPGTTLFILDTGHSIHNERPIYLANQIVQFLLTPPQNAGGAAGTGTGTAGPLGTGTSTGTGPAAVAGTGTGTGTTAPTGTGTGTGPPLPA